MDKTHYEAALEAERDYWREVAYTIKSDVRCSACAQGDGHRDAQGYRETCPLEMIPDLERDETASSNDAVFDGRDIVSVLRQSRGEGCVCGALCGCECGCAAIWPEKNIEAACREIERLREKTGDRASFEAMSGLVMGSLASGSFQPHSATSEMF